MNITIGPTVRREVPPRTAWFVKRTKSPDIDGPLKVQYWIFRPLECLLSRFRNGLVHVNRIFAADRPGAIVLSCPQGRRLVAIDVSHSQGVCFSMRSLVALSSNVHIESYMNLSLAASGADRNFVYMAWCPRPGQQGAIVLETNGEPAVMRNSESSFDIHRLMAWDPRVEFRFGDLVGLADVIMTRPHASARWNYEGDAVLLEADDSVGQPVVRKMLRSLASIVLPGL
jgi:hypothetical protein